MIPHSARKRRFHSFENVSNCNHGAKVQKHIEKHRLRIFDLHKVTEDNQMCGAADRQEFRDSLDQAQK